MCASQSFASTNLQLSLGRSDLFVRRLAKSLQPPNQDSRKGVDETPLAQLNGSSATPSFEAQRAIVMAFISRRASERSNACTDRDSLHQFTRPEINEVPQDPQPRRSYAHQDSSTPSSGIATSPLTDDVYDALRPDRASHDVSMLRSDLPMLALGKQHHRYSSPGPAANLASSTVDFARELNRWATTPGDGMVYPWSAPAVTPPSASSRDHFSSSSSLTLTNNRNVASSVLDPRFGGLTADTALRMLPESPGFASMSCADSDTTSNSSEHLLSSYLSLSVTSSRSFATPPSPFDQIGEPHDDGRMQSPKRNSSVPLHTLQEARRRSSAPRSQSQHTHDHLTSVHPDFTQFDVPTSAESFALTAPSKTHSRRTSALDSNGRYVCRLPGCDKTFSTSGHARRHSHIHSPLCPFICPHEGCDATFSRRDNCTQHQHARHSPVLEAHRLDDQDSG